MEFKPVICHQNSYQRYIALFQACFAGSAKFSTEYLDWLYRQNPEGEVVGFDAWEGEKLAAHYVTIPSRARILGQDCRVLLSLNTATHPDFQGKGLFTKLAELTYGAGAVQGFTGVYGVANANSTPGFTRKLNFKLIKQLDAKIGLGRPGIDFSAFSVASEFNCQWNEAALDWRCRNPVKPVRRATKANHHYFTATAFPAMTVLAELADNFNAQQSKNVPETGGLATPCHLFLGLVPKSMKKRDFFVDIPKIMRPSPLNLIYRPLTASPITINPDAVYFTFLDFDAY